MSTSNRAGHPVRMRKKNRLIFNEDEETSFGPRIQLYQMPTNTKQSKLTPNSQTKIQQQEQQQEETTIIPKGKFNKNIGNNLVDTLRTLLKLPKANNWVNHEWFYGSIDQVLFLDENEFNFCLKDSFPQLKTRYLTRMEWSQIRRLMGKPRRCSASFFEEERATLNAKRNKIRYLQQNKVSDLNPYKDLPDYIPQSLVVGTKVSALARSHDGVFLGVVEGIDSTNGTYRVSFDKSDIGCLSIPDYEVASIDPPVLAPLSSFQVKTRKPWHLSNRYLDFLEESGSNQGLPSENIVTPRPVTEFINEKNIGGFPIKFLTHLVKVSQKLDLKKKKISEFKTMNDMIERMLSLSKPIPYNFKQAYANTVLELEEIDQELNFYLKKIQNYSLQVSSDGKLQSLKPDVLNQKFQNESRQLIEQLQSKHKVNEKSRNLIIGLMSLLVHLRGFRDCDISSYEIESILKAIENTRKMLHPKNYVVFENSVEIHIRHIISSVSHMGNMGAFSDSTNNDFKEN